MMHGPFDDQPTLGDVMALVVLFFIVGVIFWLFGA